MGLPGLNAETTLYTTTGRYFTLGGGLQLRDLTAAPLADLFRWQGGFLHLLCGGLGQPCCRAPEASQNILAFGPLVSCDDGLGCDITTNTCTSQCGAPGQVCCDGPETRAPKWTADGRVYSPNSPFMREMCNTGACDRQSHRCFTCGNMDGGPCCPPDAAQATARCLGPGLECEFDQGGFYTSGTCRACGIIGRKPCSWGCSPGLSVRNGLCDLCGGEFQPPCDNGCNPGLAIAAGVCRQCGNAGQIPCDFGCRGSLKLQNGVCATCGGIGQLPCDGGCKPGAVLRNGVCVACGYDGQPPCASSWPTPSGGCVYPKKVAGGVCRDCGANGQIPCDTGCNSGLVSINGYCAKPPSTPPGPVCAVSGQICSTGQTPIGPNDPPFCCNNRGSDGNGPPLLCLYGTCRPCFLRGESIPPGMKGPCCNSEDVPQLDPATGGEKCDIPDLP